MDLVQALGTWVNSTVWENISHAGVPLSGPVTIGLSRTLQPNPKGSEILQSNHDDVESHAGLNIRAGRAGLLIVF